MNNFNLKADNLNIYSLTTHNRYNNFNIEHRYRDQLVFSSLLQHSIELIYTDFEDALFYFFFSYAKMRVVVEKLYFR